MREATWYRWNDMPKEKVSSMLDRRLITGERMMLSHLYLKKGCIVPTHLHDNEQLTSSDRLEAVLQGHKPGDRLRATIRRRGTDQNVTITLEEDPRLQIVAAEDAGRRLAPAERAFRDAWLRSRR